MGRIQKNMPRNRFARIVIGLLLIIGGILGFLPVLGFWMIPLGVIVLSMDIPAVRRFRRRLEVHWGNRQGRKAKRKLRREQKRESKRREREQ